jgi:hypothetical protein
MASVVILNVMVPFEYTFTERVAANSWPGLQTHILANTGADWSDPPKVNFIKLFWA